MPGEDPIALRVERLRAARERFGWSQRELARRCGMSEVQIGRYEKGQMEPSANNLKSMAEVLNLSSDYLIGLTDDPRGHLGEKLMSGNEQELVEAFRRDGDAGVAQWLADRLKK